MNCGHCGAELPSRPTARVIMTGILFVAAALLLVVFVHVAIVVLAGMLLLIVGGSLLTGALKVMLRRCPKCGRFSPLGSKLIVR